MRKSHPVRRAVLATAATVSGIVLLLTLKPDSDQGSADAAGAVPPAAAQSPQGGAQAIANGTVTGDAVDTQYGAVQVRLTVSGGKITKAEAVQSPEGGQSDQINANAVPKLNQAAVAAQSGEIDAVSGATYTSAGYKKSLQSALDKAKAAGAAGSGTGEGGAGSAQALGDGTVTGDAVDTQYGAVQVRLTVSGGKITKAEAVQSPEGGQSDQINANAVPKLNQAAVAAQSGEIDAVSGATYTSAGYKKSLQSALDQAKAAGAAGAAGSGGDAIGDGSDGDSSDGSGQGEGGGNAQASLEDGTVTGDAVQTEYGAVQVRITVEGGRITKTEAVQAPKGGQSDRVTNLSVPRLNQAVVKTGGADIDAVSGATYTSAGYKKSLQSALDQAGG
ncbi:FMN-binding protein [Streptomyces sp. KMM 9044]|uniref:FMN-binding protein n=1 Tax=Streptomyces sp. KMM 9044 TaxID=2744474 RepID=UPI002151B12A|nr:FMN-binding protein [Streptomyces sp. KMM 9044]WAX80972.1 FMN-binding protein [Streptomyces sp. KMM 9044]